VSVVGVARRRLRAARGREGFGRLRAPRVAPDGRTIASCRAGALLAGAQGALLVASRTAGCAPARADPRRSISAAA